ncbi:MAG TPA: hypothetical protein VGH00_09175 [Chthoniobacterales bacterium]
MADAIIGDAIDGLVGPFRGSGREGLGVGVAGGGVDGEQDEAFAVGAIDLEFALTGRTMKRPQPQLWLIERRSARST